ncbi:MAG: beta-lactamase family protein, partial [Bacteroidetes bacterium]|nr:beta-lactamase family protein [Bacteroidota bacterium]
MENRFFILLLSFSISLASYAQDSQYVKLDAYFEKALTDWEVPGMAIGIIKDNNIWMAKGYGVRNSASKGEVNAQTIFPIASNTKAFTSAALASLVDKKLISWDDRVVDYISYFQLYDPYVTQMMTIRDLLCHRSGLATFSGDLLWFN